MQDMSTSEKVCSIDEISIITHHKQRLASAASPTAVIRCDNTNYSYCDNYHPNENSIDNAPVSLRGTREPGREAGSEGPTHLTSLVCNYGNTRQSPHIRSRNTARMTIDSSAQGGEPALHIFVNILVQIHIPPGMQAICGNDSRTMHQSCTHCKRCTNGE